MWIDSLTHFAVLQVNGNVFYRCGRVTSIPDTVFFKPEKFCLNLWHHRQHLKIEITEEREKKTKKQKLKTKAQILDLTSCLDSLNFERIFHQFHCGKENNYASCLSDSVILPTFTPDLVWSKTPTTCCRNHTGPIGLQWCICWLKLVLSHRSAQAVTELGQTKKKGRKKKTEKTAQWNLISGTQLLSQQLVGRFGKSCFPFFARWGTVHLEYSSIQCTHPCYQLHREINIG